MTAGACISASAVISPGLETLTQIDRQHGPAITISVSPLLPASLHSPRCYALPLLAVNPPSHLPWSCSFNLSLPNPPTLFPPLSLCPQSHIRSPNPLLSSLLFCIFSSPSCLDLTASLCHFCPSLPRSNPTPGFISCHLSPVAPFVFFFTLAYSHFIFSLLPLHHCTVSHLSPRWSSISSQSPLMCSFPLYLASSSPVILFSFPWLLVHTLNSSPHVALLFQWPTVTDLVTCLCWIAYESKIVNLGMDF